jgi:3-phosphoshikimate 1-carboxyvinyltransferase
LRSIELTVPGDASAAAFFVCAAAALPGSRLVVRNMGLNPLRTGFLRVLERMGAAIDVRARGEACGEPAGDLEVTGGTLGGTTIEADEVPALVDEIPALSVIAASSGSPTVIGGAAELRVKETDRLSALAEGLGALGAEVRERPDGLELSGTGFRSGGTIDARGDHRIAMSFALAGLFAPGRVVVNGAETAAISDPDFWATLERLRAT